MRLSRWMGLIAALVVLGCLQVAQHNALYLQGYAVGERLTRINREETELAWLQAQVIGLSSPATLAHAAEHRHLKLVAWSTLSLKDSQTEGITSMALQTGERSPTDHSLVTVAAADREDTAASSGEDTAD